MYSELIHNFTENTEYSFNLDIDINTKNSVESFSDLENRVFSLKDCWEFNGFVDGSYLAVSENGKIPIIDKMGSEYEVLVNEFVGPSSKVRNTLLLLLGIFQTHEG